MGQLRDNAEVDLKVLKGTDLGQVAVAGFFEKDSECWSMCQPKVCHILQQDCAPLIS